MLVVVVLLVGTVPLTVIVGMWMICKIKLGFVANQAAQFAAGNLSWNTNYNPPPAGVTPFITAQAKVQDIVNQLCQATKLPSPATTTVTDNGATVTVTVAVSGMITPFGIPFPVMISDTAVADLTVYQPPAILEVHPQNATESKYSAAIPCYGYTNNLNLRSTPPYSFYISLPGTPSWN
jgi:hypothetical protein